ncbi:unnamed protein product [Clonostachys rosea]|uniref:Uncharacterized protein n=1 Tax=Bionectria ochroleuca TaxID=29856 RepID=A0ABY6TXH0_BIOOC|nr:unnamed protein product [Clonostachys rosea]
MFACKARKLLVGSRPSFSARQLSIKAAYSGSFPTTLHHYRPTPQTILYDRAERESRPHVWFEDSVVEVVRQYYDEMLDQKDEGVKVDVPYIFTIARDLNDRLHDFLAQHSIKEKADSWLDKHPYSEAFPDTEVDKWMKE